VQVAGTQLPGLGVAQGSLRTVLRSFLLAVLVLVAAVLVARAVPSQPLIGLTLPAVLLSAAACRAWPAAATTLLYLVSGLYITIRAYLGIRIGVVIDPILAGLWVGVAWTLLNGRRSQSVLIWPGIAATALYVLLTGLEVSTAPSFSLGFLSFRYQAWYLSAFLLLAVAPWEDETRKRILLGVIGTAFVVGVYCTIRSITGNTEAELAASGIVRGNSLDKRFIGSFGSPQDLASWTSTAAVFCFAQALALRGRWRVISASAVLACVIALLASNIRAGLVAAVLGCAVALLLYQLSRAFPGPRLGIVVTAMILAFAAGTFAFGFTGGGSAKSSHYAAIFNPSKDLSFAQRQQSWSLAMEIAKRHPFGEGLGTVGAVRQTHPSFDAIESGDLDSSYIKVALEQGIPVLAFLVMALLVLWFGIARRAVLTSDPARAGPAIGAAAVLAALLVLFYVGDYIEGSSALAGWLLVGLGVAGLTHPGADRPQVVTDPTAAR
jgi:hypothetical protein